MGYLSAISARFVEIESGRTFRLHNRPARAQVEFLASIAGRANKLFVRSEPGPGNFGQGRPQVGTILKSIFTKEKKFHQFSFFFS